MAHAGSCHCEAVRFEVDGTIERVIDCNCSMCRRRGGLLWFTPAQGFRLVAEEGALATYTFNRHVIRHHFCTRCGIATHGEGTAPDGTAMVAVNVRCVEDLDLDRLEVASFDGRAA